MSVIIKIFFTRWFSAFGVFAPAVSRFAAVTEFIKTQLVPRVTDNLIRIKIPSLKYK